MGKSIETFEGKGSQFTFAQMVEKVSDLKKTDDNLASSQEKVIIKQDNVNVPEEYNAEAISIENESIFIKEEVKEIIQEKPEIKEPVTDPLEQENKS